MAGEFVFGSTRSTLCNAEKNVCHNLIYFFCCFLKPLCGCIEQNDIERFDIGGGGGGSVKAGKGKPQRKSTQIKRKHLKTCQSVLCGGIERQIYAV